MSEQSLQQLLAIMATLRDPNKGCDWDKQQTFSSIVPHTIEEAYEVADTIERGAMDELKDELGDLLFQVVFYAQMAKEQNLFDFNEVVENLNDKLVRRHPHVFESQAQLSEQELEQQWQAIKSKERSDKPAHSLKPLWSDIPNSLPALSRAQKVQKRAAALGFDWPSYHGAFEKVEEEVQEVQQALAHDPHSAHTAEELGDLLFATVNVVRHTKNDPEQVLRKASDKFTARFAAVDTELSKAGIALDKATLEQMDAAWNKIKRDPN